MATPQSTLQALQLATRRSSVPLVPAVGSVLFFTRVSHHPWAAYYASQLRRRDRTKAILAVARHVPLMGQPPREWTHSESRQVGCAAGIDLDLDFGSALRVMQQRALHRLVAGTDVPVEVGESEDDDSTSVRARVVLVDMCPTEGFPQSQQHAGGDLNTCLLRSMEALQTCAPLLHRDAAVLCRLPFDLDTMTHLFRGIRDVFSDCRFVVKTPEDGTKLLLAARTHSHVATHGTVKRGWEEYHRKLIPRRLMKLRPFGELAPTRAMKLKRHFATTLRSRNLELTPPAKVAQRQLDALRSTIQRDADTELLGTIGASTEAAAKSEAREGAPRHF